MPSSLGPSTRNVTAELARPTAAVSSLPQPYQSTSPAAAAAAASRRRSSMSSSHPGQQWPPTKSSAPRTCPAWRMQAAFAFCRATERRACQAPRSRAGPHDPMNASYGDRSQVALAASRKKPRASEPHRPKVSTERGTSRPPGRAKAGYRACFPFAAPSAAAPSRSAAPATRAEASGWDTTTPP